VSRLQLALDLTDLGRALEVARACLDWVDLLEAGTPLIKSVGMEAVRRLAELPRPVVADTKTADAGRLEVEMAAEAGASVVTVLASAPDPVLRAAVEAAGELGVEVMADLLGVRDKPGRAARVAEMGVDYVLVHVGLDEQAAGLSPVEEARRVADAVDARLAVAGGLDPERVRALSDLGVDVFIVGGYITRSPDPASAARRVREALP